MAPRARQSSRDWKGRQVTLLGAGAVGSALAVQLARQGARLTISSRNPRRAGAARRAVLANVPGSASRVSTRAFAAGTDPECELCLICVSDSAVESVARGLARHLADRPRASAPAVLHTSGYWGAEPLEVVARAGRPTGWLHPLVSLPAGGRAARLAAALEGRWFAIGGDPRAVRWARRVQRALGGRELPISDAPGAQRDYHAGAALLAGGAVALFDAALELLERASPDSQASAKALGALFETTLENLGRRGAARALTGPIARGDVAVVAGHLERLQAKPELAELYRALGRRMLALSTDLSERERRGLRKLLRSG